VVTQWRDVEALAHRMVAAGKDVGALHFTGPDGGEQMTLHGGSVGVTTYYNAAWSLVQTCDGTYWDADGKVTL